MSRARTLPWLLLADSVVRAILGAALLRYLGAPWWAVCWFVLSRFGLRLFSPRDRGQRR